MMPDRKPSIAPFGTADAVASLPAGAVAALPEAMQAECVLLMRERGMGVGAMAAATGLTPGHVAALLRGGYRPFLRTNMNGEAA